MNRMESGTLTDTLTQWQVFVSMPVNQLKILLSTGKKYLKHIKQVRELLSGIYKNSYKPIRKRQFKQKNKWAQNMNM